MTTTCGASAEPAASRKIHEPLPPLNCCIQFTRRCPGLTPGQTLRQLCLAFCARLHCSSQLSFKAQAFIHFPGMASASPPELSAALSEVLRDCNVRDAMRQALQELLTVEDFAYAFPTLSHLDSLFSNLDSEVKETQPSQMQPPPCTAPGSGHSALHPPS